jgi:hypothetical protein
MKRLLLASYVLALACAHVDAQDYPSGALPMVGYISAANTGGGLNVFLPVSGVTVPPNKVVYICGFNVNGLGATALTNVGVNLYSTQRGDGAGATPLFAYQFPAGVTAIATPITMNFSPCLAANGPGNNTINVFVPGAAGNTQTNIMLWGYAK